MKKYIFILLTSFSLASCVDLLQEPQSKLTPATIELTEQTLESMTNGLYKDLWGENFGFNWFFVKFGGTSSIVNK